ncbi:MAG TPA: response regulator, partial [Thermoanaerobaculia bacterium]|nr:response regulator [Thermoanaerobaculia bacterium]
MTDDARVLVIDDDTGSREAMAIAIEKAGWAVERFDDAVRALDYLESNGAARLAICDLRMPGMDGLGFLQEVRKREFHLSVILVTAYGSIET